MNDTITLPRAVIEQAVKALAECYDVESYPSDGSTQQDAALTELRAALAQQAEPTHYLDAMGLCYTAARAKFIGMDVESMVALYAAPQVTQQAEQGWQPISTAPKDGTVILLFRNKEVLAGAFHPELGKYPWLIIEESKDGTNGLQEGVHGPTHWMPLPEAPKEIK